MVVIVNNPADLVNVLTMLSANDTNIVKQGEKALKPILKQPMCLPALLNIVGSRELTEVVRHQAAVLLKKKATLYSKFNESEKVSIRAQFLSAMVNENVKVIGTALAGAVAALAKASMASKHPTQWPELFQAIMTLAQHPEERLKVLTYSLLAQVSIKSNFISFFLSQRALINLFLYIF